MVVTGVRTEQSPAQGNSLPKPTREERRTGTVQHELNQPNVHLRTRNGVISRTDGLRQRQEETLLYSIAPSNALKVRHTRVRASTNDASQRNRVDVGAEARGLRRRLHHKQKDECQHRRFAKLHEPPDCVGRLTDRAQRLS